MATNYLHQFQNPKFLNHATGEVMPNGSGWQTRHRHALMRQRVEERGIYSLISGWAEYADRHSARYESGIGTDYVLGDAWAEIGGSIRKLLDGETGRFDCGTLASFVSETLIAEGWNPDTMERSK